MAVLNLSCGNKNDKDQNQIVVQDNNLISVIEGNQTCKLSMVDLYWDCNTVSCYNITLPKNGYVEIKFRDLFGDTSKGKFIAIKPENRMNVEKKFENSNLFIQFASSNNLPLGKFFVMSGTDSNSIESTFKVYNGTPNANISNITGGTYEVTLSVMVGYN